MKRILALMLGPLLLVACPQPVNDTVPPNLTAITAPQTICDVENQTLEATLDFSFVFTGVVRGFTVYLTPSTFDADNDPNTPPEPVTNPKTLPAALRVTANFSGASSTGGVTETLILRPGPNGVTVQAIGVNPVTERLLWIEARNTAGPSNLISSAPIQVDKRMGCTSSDVLFGAPKVESLRTQTKYCSALSGTPRSSIDFEFRFENTMRGYEIAFTPALNNGVTPSSPNEFDSTDVLKRTIKQDAYRGGRVRTALEVITDKDGGIGLAGLQPNAIAVGRDSRLWVRAFNDVGKSAWLRSDVIEVTSDSSTCDPAPGFVFFGF